MDQPVSEGNDASKGRVLVVDDEANAREALVELLADEGYDADSAADGRRALEVMGQFEPHVVLTDLKMPVLDGLGLLKQGRERHPHVAFVVMTAFGTIDTAVEAIKSGAENYLTKPVDLDALSALVARAMEKAKLSEEAARLRGRLDERLALDNIVGDHPSMQRLGKLVAQVAKSRATVLIHGETGTGKELIAAAIHQHSPRREGPFVRLNCAALAETLLESELFGHEKGAFTGATARRHGRFEQADGGTLFLDEVSEIPLPLQVKLLRFLQEKQFERVGGNETITVDVRIVAASNRDLAEQVKDGDFREDLYYRLNVVQLDVPPLRARRSDIPLLAEHFVKKHAEENGFDVQGFSDEALLALMSYPWPGNVRELDNAIERAVVMTAGSTIETEHLPALAGSPQQDSLGVLVPGLTLAELERQAILQALEAAGGSTQKAAELLGISRRKIQYRLKEWGQDGGEGSET
ncbi:MAG: sigma-54 dependent transcriptional regulator [Myxococcales bacterium]|nr:sigma-54 dependent transcriptional regulator [Myxococcales bacterium]